MNRKDGEFRDKFGAPLPSSIVLVIESVLELEECLSSSDDGPLFPDLRNSPSSDADVESAIKAAAAWAAHVRQLVGVGQRYRAYGGRGILPMFGGRSNFAHAEEPSRLLGKIPDHLIDDPAHTYFYFERVFHRVEEPVQGSSRSLTDPAVRSVGFTASNWPHVRSKLDQGRILIQARAQDLAEWILGRVHLVYGWAPERRVTGRGRLQEGSGADDRLAAARKAIDAWPGEWVPRSALKGLGVPPTAVDQHFGTDPDRFRADKRKGGSREQVEYRKGFVLEYVRRVWKPRERT